MRTLGGALSFASGVQADGCPLECLSRAVGTSPGGHTGPDWGRQMGAEGYRTGRLVGHGQRAEAFREGGS